MTATATRLALVVVAVFVLVAPLAAEAQQPEKVHRLGVLSPIFPRSRHEMLDLILNDLRGRGFIEGKNLLIEHRSALGRLELLADLAGELARLKMDVIMAEAPPAIRAAQNATKTVPIVMFSGDDPVRAGFVATLGRPGGNITGVALLAADLSAKRLEFLRMAMPGAQRVAILLNPANPNSLLRLKELNAAAGSLQLQLSIIETRGSEQLDDAFALITRARPDAFLTLPDPLFFRERLRIGEFAAGTRLPMISDWRQMAEAGALIAYGPSFSAMARRGAGYIDRIFKGANPAVLPVEQPTEVDLVINLKTAKTLGLAIPQSLLLRANKVIE